MFRNILCKKKLSPVVMLAILIAAVIVPAARSAEPEAPLDIKVQTIGEGRPVLAIPGLNSRSDVFRETCEALKGVQCHLVQLPGFAGAPAAKHEAFLDVMSQQVLAYAKREKLHNPAVIGHSLGGFMALKLALAAPDEIGPLVIVDALPFLPAAGNPAATAESNQPMAQMMRQRMSETDEATFRQQAAASVQSMSRDPKRVEEIARWSADSDRDTTAQALYELMTTDLRGELGKVHSPALVLASWAAYAALGQTQDATRTIFDAQYAALPGVRIEMSEAGYHFLMWDDPQWLRTQIAEFLAAHPAKGE